MPSLGKVSSSAYPKGGLGVEDWGTEKLLLKNMRVLFTLDEIGRSW